METAAVESSQFRADLWSVAVGREIDESYGRETLSEAITDAMADVLLRARDRHPLEMVKEVLRDWKSLSHAKLFELVGPATHDGDVKAYLSRARDS